MKKIALVVNYFIFIVLFALMFLQTTGVIELTKYLLLLVASYTLLRTTIKKGLSKTMFAFNYLFTTSTIIYILYGLFFKGNLFMNITLYFMAASIIGFGLSLSLKAKKTTKKTVKKIVFRAPKKPIAKKTTKKKATKKTAKKTTKKKVAKKTTKKKTAKKTTKKKVAKKTVTKKTVKRSARSKAMDAKLVSYTQVHEMKTVLKHFKKRTTNDNIKKL